MLAAPPTLQSAPRGIWIPQRIQPVPAGFAEDVAPHRSQLHVGFLQHALHSMAFVGRATHYRFPPTSPIAPFSCLPIRNKARPNHPMPQPVRYPAGIVTIRFMAAQILDRLCVGQYNLDLTVIQNVVDRPPVRSSALHGNVRNVVFLQPLAHPLQVFVSGAKPSCLWCGFRWGLSHHQTNIDILPAHIDTRTTFHHGWNHMPSPLSRVRAKAYWFKWLFEFTLNSGYDQLAPGLVHHR